MGFAMQQGGAHGGGVLMPEGNDEWTLEDLVDLEVVLNEPLEVTPGEVTAVRESLQEEPKPEGEGQKRRRGLRRWLKKRTPRDAADRTPGEKLAQVIKVVGLAFFLLSAFGGIALVKGLVGEVRGTEYRGINIWVFLALTIGAQWLFFAWAVASVWLWPKYKGGLDWFREGTVAILQKLTGVMNPGVWRRLTELKSGQTGVFGLRLARLLQLSSIGFNVGLLLGLFVVLGFSDVHFFWESSLPQFGPQSLLGVSNFLGLGMDSVTPGLNQVTQAQVVPGKVDFIPHEESKWRSFFWFTVFVWGLLPRAVLYGVIFWQEKQMLQGLELQDPRHRDLWRQLTKVERTVIIEGPSDGVVLLDVGGLDFDPKALRPFLLQTLRVNPEKTYAVGVLDEEKEREAWEAIKKAPCGVILLVEGWNLSPKQMQVLVERIRKEAGEDTVLRVLVLGDGLEAPEEDDFEQWQAFVDTLRDPHLECVAYEDTAIKS